MRTDLVCVLLLFLTYFKQQVKSIYLDKYKNESPSSDLNNLLIYIWLHSDCQICKKPVFKKEISLYIYFLAVKSVFAKCFHCVSCRIQFITLATH